MNGSIPCGQEIRRNAVSKRETGLSEHFGCPFRAIPKRDKIEDRISGGRLLPGSARWMPDATGLDEKKIW